MFGVWGKDVFKGTSLWGDLCFPVGAGRVYAMAVSQEGVGRVYEMGCFILWAGALSLRHSCWCLGNMM